LIKAGEDHSGGAPPAGRKHRRVTATYNRYGGERVLVPPRHALRPDVPPVFAADQDIFPTHPGYSQKLQPRSQSGLIPRAPSAPNSQAQKKRSRAPSSARPSQDKLGSLVGVVKASAGGAAKAVSRCRKQAGWDPRCGMGTQCLWSVLCLTHSNSQISALFLLEPAQPLTLPFLGKDTLLAMGTNLPELFGTTSRCAPPSRAPLKPAMSAFTPKRVLVLFPCLWRGPFGRVGAGLCIVCPLTMSLCAGSAGCWPGGAPNLQIGKWGFGYSSCF
jgi:hypothetical protein